jgi:hypothetical protein
MRTLLDVLLAMFDNTTILLVLTSVPIYFFLYCLLDRWAVLRLVTSMMRTDTLERTVRSLMMAQSRFKPRTGGTLHRILWHLALRLDVLQRVRVIEDSDEPTRWRAVVLIGQAATDVPGLKVVRKIANSQISEPSGRAAAAVLKERSTSASSGGRL